MSKTAGHKFKVCPRCKKRKLATVKNFSVDKKGVMSWCRACYSERATAWNKKNPKKSAFNHRQHVLKMRYGMTIEGYEARVKAQNGLCAICQRPPVDSHGRFSKLHVDHDHLSGKVRDLLCHHCNMGIGSLKDDPNLCRVAAAYLDWHKEREKLPS